MNRIKATRIDRGINQKELAAMAGVSQPYLFDLENNRRGARPETMARIATALGVTVNDLKGGSHDDHEGEAGDPPGDREGRPGAPGRGEEA